MGRRVTFGVVLTVILVVFLGPVLWVLSSAFKPSLQLFSYPPTIVPLHPTLQNFAKALHEGDFVRYFLNSGIVSITSTAVTLVISLTAGFALAKYRFFGDRIIFLLIMATLMIPLQVILIPIFVTLKQLGLINNLLGIILPPAATPTGVFIMRQYISTIPDSFMEAARMDGASEWGILWRIIVPLATPALAALAVFSFVWRWNDFLWPFLVINNQKLWTVQLALSNYVGQYNIDWPSLLAMTALAIIPTLIVFVALQRYFMAGLTAGGLKG